MEKIVIIGKTEVPMRANAATAMRYRQTFHGDLLTELAKEKPETENVEILQKLAFIMAMSGADENMNHLTEEKYLEWLERFEYVDLIEALPEALGVYMATQKTQSEAKKNKNQPTEK